MLLRSRKNFRFSGKEEAEAGKVKLLVVCFYLGKIGIDS